MATYVVERFAAGLTLGEVEEAAGRMAELGLTHLVSLFVPGDDAAISVFDAPDQGAVERAALAEGTPHERVMPVWLVPSTARSASAPAS